jgi:hypothetical protein
LWHLGYQLGWQLVYLSLAYAWLRYLKAS